MTVSHALSRSSITCNVSDDSSANHYPKPNNFQHRALTDIFYTAARLTDSACRCHELYHRLHIVNELHQDSYRITNFARQAFILSKLTAFAAIATITTVPGVLLRILASHLRNEPFTYMSGNAPEKAHPDGSFSALSWNLCCLAGGFSINEAALVPWRDRIDNVIEKIIEEDADVISLYEIFDTEAAFYLQDKLKEIYPHFYLDVGNLTVGASSGLFVASKFDVVQAEFTRFPEDMILDDSKYCSKGVFSFSIAAENSNDSPFAVIHATHLQHSEETSFPQADEIAARAMQMQLVARKVETNTAIASLLIGDFNFDQEEISTSEWTRNFDQDQSIENIPTWGGDRFSSERLGRQISSPTKLDYSFLRKDTAASIQTKLIETGYDGNSLNKDALTDHLGLVTTIEL